MPALLMALTLTASPTPGEAPGPPAHPQWSERPLRAALFVVTYGDGAMFEGEAVYESGVVRLRGAAVYETFASPFWRDRMMVSLSAGRQVSARRRLDFELRQGLTRASGGLAAAFTVRRAF